VAGKNCIPSVSGSCTLLTRLGPFLFRFTYLVVVFDCHLLYHIVCAGYCCPLILACLLRSVLVISSPDYRRDSRPALFVVICKCDTVCCLGEHMPGSLNRSVKRHAGDAGWWMGWRYWRASCTQSWWPNGVRTRPCSSFPSTATSAAARSFLPIISCHMLEKLLLRHVCLSAGKL
jgi:hypothetical protein